ncbi:MAG: polysaccharide lyase [Bacteroidota bacterium]
MKKIQVVLIFLLVNSGISAQLYRPKKVVVPDTVFSVEFLNHSLGQYSDKQINKNFVNVKWSLTKGRSEIVEDDKFDKVLRVKYPESAVGPEMGGIQFVRPLPANNEYYLDYYLKAEKGFDFVKGGKLPGLTSGGDKFTGGHHPEHGEGWSARYMWVQDGGLIVYLYYVDMKSKYGDHLVLKKAKLIPGKWHRITQHIVLNSDNKRNGIVQVWFDEKKVVDERNLRLRLDDKGKIDAFYFSTFHGGATPDWAPNNDSFFRFDKITVSKVAPGFISE